MLFKEIIKIISPLVCKANLKQAAQKVKLYNNSILIHTKQYKHKLFVVATTGSILYLVYNGNVVKADDVNKRSLLFSVLDGVQ